MQLNEESFRQCFLQLAADINDDVTPIRVLVTLSGGPDSVALLHLVHELADREGLQVFAAHVNYGLRGQESEQDDKFCLDLCRRLDIRLFRKKASLRKLKSANLQDRARQVRYEFFDKLCEQYQINLVATGHNKSDNAETMLINLFRGAGTFGLSGIKRKRGRIVRPLLDFSREEIIEFLQRQSIGYRVDSSNVKPKYLRNRVRLELMPKIEELFGKTSLDNIARAAGIIATQEEYLRHQADKRFRRDAHWTPFGKIVLDLKRFRGYHDISKCLMLATAFERLTGSLKDFDFAATRRVFSCIEAGSGQVDLKAKLICEVARNNLYIYRRSKRPALIAVDIPGTTLLTPYGLKLTVNLPAADRIRQEVVKKTTRKRAFLDLVSLPGKLSIRTMLPGDRFRPLGMQGSKKLSDFFIDRKLERPLREEVPLLLAGGEIVWVVGQEIAEPAKVTSGSRQIIKLEVRKLSRSPIPDEYSKS